MQIHCRRCCHHAAHSCSSCTCACAASHSAPSGYQTAYGALSFLQPPCTAQMAKERHLPFEWSLMMRAFASWKVCEALRRPHVAAYAESTHVQLVYMTQMHMCPDSINNKSCICSSIAAKLDMMSIPTCSWSGQWHLLPQCTVCHKLCDTQCRYDYAFEMQASCGADSRGQDAPCGLRSHGNNMLMYKCPYVDKENSMHPLRQYSRLFSITALPDRHWQGPYGSLYTDSGSCTKLQAVDGVYHLPKHRIAS